jgi:hypothetical protein
MSVNSEETEREHKFRFHNNRNIDLVVGIEPLGLYYHVPPKKDIEIIFYLRTDHDEKNEYHEIYVEEDGGLTLEIWSVDITVYIDHEIFYP